MDISFQIVFAFLIFIFMLLKLSSSSRTKKLTPCLPPGPWKLPIIGNIHHLGGSLPHQRFKSLAEKYGPLMHLQLGELSVIVVSSPETAKEVMKTHDVNFADRPYLYANKVICKGARNISFSPYRDYWRQIRKICSQELLSPTRVQSFGPAREEEVSNFIKSISEHVGNQINLSEKIISLTYGMTARSAFGKKCKDQELFIELVKEASAAAAGFNISDLYPSSTLLPILMGFKAKLENIRGRYDEITGNIIKEHQAKKVVIYEDEDLVDVLLRFQGDVEFPLSIADMKSIIMEPDIAFAFLIFIFMLLKLSSSSRTKKLTPCLPPGPWKLPIIGNIHHLGGSLPHQRFKSLAEKYGPLMHLQLGELSVIVVSSPETAKEVMKTHDVNFADRPYLYANKVICKGARNISFSPYGDYWRQIRKICSQELLSPTRVQSFGPAREEEVSNFIKSISEHVGNQINLSEKIISLTYGMTARSAFGKKCKDQELFIELVKEASAAAAGFNISDLYPSSNLLPILMGFKAKLENIRGRYDEITGNIIKEHQAKKVVIYEDEDLVDVLLRFQGDVEFPLSIADMKSIIMEKELRILSSIDVSNGI
ncbi:Cytochrome P450 [Artemisia annua]|uniref:Cytochrome P450 n=1 Tax=Artemisia annua TaxID=35608 RepID=A0A2U1N4M2_ARTAN|nr:Cytochrome P450 [Artemisia annua]